MEFMSSLQGGTDDLKPSLFELLSEQQLAALLPPSLRYLLALATHRSPRYLIRILNSFDECYAVFSLVIEYYFLKTYAGGFTENFYGLKRVRVLRNKGSEIPRAQLGTPAAVRETLQLRDRDLWTNLAIMVGLPYLKRKLDEGFEVHVPQVAALGPGFNRDTWPAEGTPRQRILHCYKWFLRKIYPSMNAAYYFALLVFNLGYLFDNTKYHSPWFWLVATRMRRMGQADHDAIEAAASKMTGLDPTGTHRPGQVSSILNPHALGRIVYPGVLSSFRFLLPTSIFALKFLEWWHASDFARQLSRKATEGLELPPPIISEQSEDVNRSSSNLKTFLRNKAKPVFASQHKPPISSSSHLPIFTVPPPNNETSTLCPICLQPITAATASPYGYVYCYVCIHKWIEGDHKRQQAFMEGGAEEEKAWGEQDARHESGDSPEASREGRWESGKGRCAVTGKRILSGTEGLRRVVV